jgi:hypothetical protein
MKQAIVIGVLAAICASSCSGGEVDEAKYFPPDSNPYDHDYSDWSIRWWQWAMSFPKEDSPFNDVPGDPFDFSRRQSEPVWFLTGHDAHATLPVERDVTITSDRAVFFPIINAIWYSCPEIVGVEDCAFADQDFLDDQAESFFEYPVRMEVELDGKPVRNLDRFGFASSTFHIEYTETSGSLLSHQACTDEPGCLPVEDVDCILDWEEGNECGMPAEQKHFISSGYWVMLEPLEPGSHTLRIYGVFNPSDPYFTEDITYNITVPE